MCRSVGIYTGQCFLYYVSLCFYLRVNKDEYNVSDAHRMGNWVDVCLLYEVDHRVELNF